MSDTMSSYSSSPYPSTLDLKAGGPCRSEKKARRFPCPVGSYGKICQSWPDEGRQLLVAGTQDSVTLYISCPEYYVTDIIRSQNTRKTRSHEKLDWNLTPSFLRGIRRADWALKRDHERVLAVTVKRSGFEELLRMGLEGNREDSGKPLVNLSWAMDICPLGFRTNRKVVQIKLHEEIMKHFLLDIVVQIDDITEFVRKQRQLVIGFSWDHWTQIIFKMRMPREKTYEFLYDTTLSRRLGLDPEEDDSSSINSS